MTILYAGVFILGTIFGGAAVSWYTNRIEKAEEKGRSEAK